MIASHTAGQGDARSATKPPVDLNAAALDHAVGLIHQVCCFAGSFDLLDEFRDDALRAAIERHDTPALFDRLIPECARRRAGYAATALLGTELCTEQRERQRSMVGSRGHRRLLQFDAKDRRKRHEPA